jgi:hypothetical protein
MAIDWENLTRPQTGVVLKTLLEQMTTEEAKRTKQFQAILAGFEKLDEQLETIVRQAVAEALQDPVTAQRLWSQRRRPSVFK